MDIPSVKTGQQLFYINLLPSRLLGLLGPTVCLGPLPCHCGAWPACIWPQNLAQPAKLQNSCGQECAEVE